MGIIYNKTIHCDCCNHDIPTKEWYKYNNDYTNRESVKLLELLDSTCSEDGTNFLQICPICGYVTGLGLTDVYDISTIRLIVETEKYQDIRMADKLPLLFRKWRLMVCLCNTLEDYHMTAITTYKLYDIVTELNINMENIEGFSNDECLKSSANNIINYSENNTMDDDEYFFYLILLLEIYRRLKDKEHFNFYYTYIKDIISQSNEEFNKLIDKEVTLFNNNDFTKKKIFT